MTDRCIVENKHNLLKLHPFLRLRLAHAAIVRSYECDIPNTASVNRMLMFYDENPTGKFSVREIDTGRVHRPQTGQIFMMPCNYNVHTTVTPGIEFVSIHFNLDLFYGFDLFYDHGKCELTDGGQMPLQMKELLEGHDDIKTLCRINETIYKICGVWLQKKEKTLQSQFSAWRKYEEIINFVQNHGDASTTVEQLAEMKFMRKDVFSRSFTKDIGVTPKDFLTGTLMRKATEMLLTPDIAIYSVAEALNFSSVYYFSRFFKKHARISPKEFQKMNSGEKHF